MYSIYELPSNISLSLTTTYPFYIRPTFATVKPIIQIMDKKTIVVVGAGQGLGNHVAERFGKEGFRVVLMARGEQSLKAYAQEFAGKNGTVILTGGGLATHPTAGFIPLSLDKAALRTLAYILHDELKPQGIFVGMVTVCGSIGIDTYFAPAQIAEAYWQMYKERGACEVRYEYPELKGCELPAGEYWKKVYELSEKYK